MISTTKILSWPMSTMKISFIDDLNYKNSFVVDLKNKDSLVVDLHNADSRMVDLHNTSDREVGFAPNENCCVVAKQLNPDMIIICTLVALKHNLCEETS